MLSLVDVDARTMNITVNELVNRIEKGEIILDENIEIPDKTRNFIITNILAQVPQNNIYAYMEGMTWKIIDSYFPYVIYDFMTGKYKFESCIKGIESCYYNELPVYIQRRIREKGITIIYFNAYNDNSKEYVNYFIDNIKGE